MSIGLSIGGITQNFAVDSAKIRGHGDAEGPHIIIPISFILTPSRRNDGSSGASYDLMYIDAELLLTTKLFKASRCSKPIHYYVWQAGPYPIELHFPVTRETLYHIEKLREGNLTGSVSLILQVAHHNDPAPNTTITNKPAIRSIDTAWGQDNFTIEQSRWLTNVLPQLGYNAPALIELPTTSPVLPAEYAIALPEIKKAEQYFLRGDYHETVAHCRLALDRIHDQFPREKDKMPTDGRFQWLKANLSANHTFAKAIVDANNSMANKAHHLNQLTFGRPEAETILHMTRLILAYIGNILPENLPPDALTP
jgi:hypothetical protein